MHVSQRVVSACTAMLAAGALSLPALAAQQTIYSTGFEAPTFTAGSQLLGQDGWTTAIPPFLNPSAATIATFVPNSGQQYVRVLGSDLQPAAEVMPQYQAVGSYRRPVDYDSAASGLNFVRVQSAVRLDGPRVTTGDLASANVAARSPDGTLGEIALSSDGFIYAYAPSTGVDDPPTYSLPAQLGRYYTLGIETNFTANTVQYYVDGVPLGAPLAFPAAFTSDTLSRGALVAYSRLASDGRGDYIYRWDDFSINASDFSSVPEPASAGLLLGAGALGLLARRRRRRRRA